MTNEELVLKEKGKIQYMYSREDLLGEGGLFDLVRADERAEMQGVDVWVSWDSERIQPIWMTNNEPIEMDLGRYNINNSFAYTQINLHFTKCILKISSGECAKFKIVRQP